MTYASLEVIERRHIYRVLKSMNGNLSKTAQILEIDRRTLYRKIAKYNKHRRNQIMTLNFVGGRFSDEPTSVYDFQSAYPAK